MMRGAFKDEIERRGGEVRLSQEVQRVEHTSNQVNTVVADNGGGKTRLTGAYFVVTCPPRAIR